MKYIGSGPVFLLIRYYTRVLSPPLLASLNNYFLHRPFHSVRSFNMTSLKRAANTSSSPAAAKKQKANGSITSFFGAPKTEDNAAANGQIATLSSPISRFNKEKWVASLTAEQKELLKLEIDTLDESWLAHLKEEIVTPDFMNLKRFLKKEKQSGVTIFPPEKDIYSWSRYTPLHTVKAVILGQDPYHNHNQAHGLCFSVRPPTRAPPSLKNIYKGLKNDYPAFEPPSNDGGLLIPWAERGVLMINTSLTVRAHQANSHSKQGWEKFTQKAIDTVARVRTRGVVFLAWGSHAAKKVSAVNKQRHCVLQSVHPSPLSAHNGFFTNGHFKKCNDWIAERYGDDAMIDWSLNPKKSVLAGISSSTAAEDKQDGPLVPSKHANKIAPPAVPTSGDEKNGTVKAKIVAATDIGDGFDDLDDLDDFDALEALAAVEDKFTDWSANTSSKTPTKEVAVQNKNED